MNTATAPWVIMPVVNGWAMTEQAIYDSLGQTVEPRVLVIGQGVDDTLRGALEDLSRRHADRLFCWFWDPPMPSLSGVWNRALDFVWSVGDQLALVINNDVRLKSDTYETLAKTCAHRDALFVSAVGVMAEQFHIELPTVGVDLESHGGPDFSCFLITKDCHNKYRFDENFIPAHCVTPETPVLTTALRWVPIGDIRVGAELVGVDEHHTRGESGRQQRRRCYRPTVVTSVSRRMAPCLRITMEDGRSVVCSTDHKWLTKYRYPGNVPYRWRAANALEPGWRIATPLDVWRSGNSYDEGWLAGICDGEGALRLKGRNTCEVQIAQKEGLVYEQAQSVISSLDVPFTKRIRSDNSVGIIEVAIRRHALRVLGQVRPIRLLKKLDLGALNLSVFSRKAPMDQQIKMIEDFGEQEVVTIETTEHTYIANGMIAHNCEDLDYHRRLMLAGDGRKIFSVNVPYLHYAAQTLKAMTPEQRAKTDAQIANICRAHYERSWGGPVNHERFSVKSDPRSSLDNVTTPELQTRVWATTKESSQPVREADEQVNAQDRPEGNPQPEEQLPRFGVSLEKLGEVLPVREKEPEVNADDQESEEDPRDQGRGRIRRLGRHLAGYFIERRADH